MTEALIVILCAGVGAAGAAQGRGPSGLLLGAALGPIGWLIACRLPSPQHPPYRLRSVRWR